MLGSLPRFPFPVLCDSSRCTQSGPPRALPCTRGLSWVGEALTQPTTNQLDAEQAALPRVCPRRLGCFTHGGDSPGWLRVPCEPQLLHGMGHRGLLSCPRAPGRWALQWGQHPQPGPKDSYLAVLVLGALSSFQRAELTPGSRQLSWSPLRHADAIRVEANLVHICDLGALYLVHFKRDG